MIRNPGTENLTFGKDDEFYRRLDEFRRLCLTRIQMITWIILTSPCNCWSFVKYSANYITDLFLRHYIAVIVLVLSVSAFPAAIVVLSHHERIIIVIYCLSFIFCSILTLILKKGKVVFDIKSESELLENQQLLAGFSHRIGQRTEQPGYGSNDKRRPLKRTLEDLFEPRQENGADPSVDLYRSDSYTRFCYIDESSAGPSHAFESTDSFTITNVSDDSSDYDEPPQRLSVARISADAIKAFGHPIHIFGADSYKVVSHSSDEDGSLNEPVKKFEAPVEVHHSDSYSPENSGNYGTSDAELSAIENDEGELTVESVLYNTLPYMDDDQSSESTCNDFQNDAKDEKSA